MTTTLSSLLRLPLAGIAAAVLLAGCTDGAPLGPEGPPATSLGSTDGDPYVYVRPPPASDPTDVERMVPLR